jgi:hypothetical protein
LAVEEVDDGDNAHALIVDLSEAASPPHAAG